MKSFLIIIFSLTVQLIYAQDTIIRRDGNKIVAKITEVNPNDIKYKRFDFMEGPLYTLQKERIKFVIYSNNSKESFEDYVPPLPSLINTPSSADLSISPSGWKYFYKEHRIAEPDMLAVAGKLGDKKINLAIKKTEGKKFLQDVTLIGGVIVFSAGLYLYAVNRPRKARRGSPPASASAQARMNGEYLMLGGAGCEIVSIGFRFNRKRHAHVVMDLYDKAVEKPVP